MKFRDWGILVGGFLAGYVTALCVMASGFMASPSPGPMGKWGMFLGSAKAEFLAGGRNIRLLEDFDYVDPNRIVWTAPAGSVVNGASIPQIFWSITGGPLDGRFREASMLHDVECVQMKKPWKDVHKMFYFACRCSNVPEDQAKMLYLAVRWYGPRWEVVQKTLLTTVIKNGVEEVVQKTVPVTEKVEPKAPTPEELERVKEFLTRKPSIEEISETDPARL